MVYHGIPWYTRGYTIVFFSILFLKFFSFIKYCAFTEEVDLLPKKSTFSRLEPEIRVAIMNFMIMTGISRLLR